MKKLLLAVVFFISPVFASAGTLSLGGNPVSLYQNDLTSDVTLTCDLNENESVYFWLAGFEDLPPTITFENCESLENVLSQSGTSIVDVFLPHPSLSESYYYAKGCDNDLLNHPCAGGSMQDAVDSGFYIEDFGLILEMLQPTDVGTILGVMISNTETGFLNTTGVTPSGVVSWTGDNLIKLFIGSGLGLLGSLAGWIVVLLIIYLIVFFSYRAFRKLGGAKRTGSYKGITGQMLYEHDMRNRTWKRQDNEM